MKVDDADQVASPNSPLGIGCTILAIVELRSKSAKSVPVDDVIK